MKISSNNTAVITNNYLFKSENALAKSIGRLSSGSKVNHSSDNPAGYAISSKMRSQIESLKKAVNNSNEGYNALNTAESGMAEIQSMLHRMNQLSVKAANGTNSSTDRKAIQDEIDELKKEIDSIGTSTEYNSLPLLDGSFNPKAYIEDYIGEFDNTSATYVDKNQRTEYITSSGIDDGLYSLKAGVNQKVEVMDDKGKVAYTFDRVIFDDNTKMLTLESTSDSTVSMVFKVPDYRYENSAGVMVEKGIDINGIRFAGYGDLTLQSGANEGQTIDATISKMSCEMMGIGEIDCTSAESATKAIDMCDSAIEYVSRARSRIGAYQNRLEARINSLDASIEDLTSSYSTIMDTDMAEEMTEYSRLQVLEQAGVSMLAQANQFPQEALQLLQ